MLRFHLGRYAATILAEVFWVSRVSPGLQCAIQTHEVNVIAARAPERMRGYGLRLSAEFNRRWLWTAESFLKPQALPPHRAQSAHQLSHNPLLPCDGGSPLRSRKALIRSMAPARCSAKLLVNSRIKNFRWVCSAPAKSCHHSKCLMRSPTIPSKWETARPITTSARIKHLHSGRRPRSGLTRGR